MFVQCGVIVLMEAWVSNPCNTEFVEGEHTGQDAALRAGYGAYIRLKQVKKRKRVQIKVILYKNQGKKLEGLQKSMQVLSTSLKTA